MPAIGDDTTRRDAPDIPVEELARAAKSVLEANLAMDMDDLVRATARVFGIMRAGDVVSRRMREGIEHLHAKGIIEFDDGRVALR